MDFDQEPGRRVERVFTGWLDAQHISRVTERLQGAATTPCLECLIEQVDIAGIGDDHRNTWKELLELGLGPARNSKGEALNGQVWAVDPKISYS